MKRKFATILTMGLVLSTQAWAETESLSLVCFPSAAGAPRTEIREVFIEKDRESVVLTDSWGNNLEARTFAVIIEMVIGPRGRPATERWHVRKEGEFTHSKRGNVHLFSDVKLGKNYSCDPNRTVRANPALPSAN